MAGTVCDLSSHRRLFCSFTYVEAGSGFSYKKKKKWFRRHKAIRVHFMSMIVFLLVVLMCKFGVCLSFNKPTSLFGCTFWSHFPEQGEAVCHCSTARSWFVFCLWMKAHSSGIHLCSLRSLYKQFIMKGGRKLKIVHNIRVLVSGFEIDQSFAGTIIWVYVARLHIILSYTNSNCDQRLRQYPNIYLSRSNLAEVAGNTFKWTTYF